MRKRQNWDEIEQVRRNAPPCFDLAMLIRPVHRVFLPSHIFILLPQSSPTLVPHVKFFCHWPHVSHTAEAAVWWRNANLSKRVRENSGMDGIKSRRVRGSDGWGRLKTKREKKSDAKTKARLDEVGSDIQRPCIRFLNAFPAAPPSLFPLLSFVVHGIAWEPRTHKCPQHETKFLFHSCGRGIHVGKKK